jgi:hypothetical protein
MGQIKALKEIEEKIEKLGATVLSVEHHRNHYKFRLEYKNVSRMFVKAFTPSDFRGELNFFGDVKRWMRSL